MVEFITYLVGRDSLQAFVEIGTKIFPTIFPCTDYPPNTSFIMRGLVHEEFKVEIKAVDALP